jgi:hypothetical protein
MPQAHEFLGLTTETVHKISVVQQVGLDHLENDGTIALGVAGTIDSENFSLAYGLE